MAVPIFQEAEAGASLAATGNLSVAFPVTALMANDLFLLQCTVRNTTTTVSTPTDFSLLYGPDSNGTTRQYVFGKVATGSESGNITVSYGSDAGVLKMGRCYRFRGTATSSYNENLNSSGFNTGSSGTLTCPSVVTGNYDDLALAFNFVSDDNAVADFLGESGGNWTETVAEYTTTAGTDGCIQLQSASMVKQGIISGGGMSMAAADTWGVRAFAIISSNPSKVLSIGYGQLSPVLQSPSVQITGGGGVTVTPSVLTLISSVQTPNIITDAIFTVGVLTVIASVQSPTISTSNDVTVTPSVLTLTASIQAPSILVGTIITASVLNIYVMVDTKDFTQDANCQGAWLLNETSGNAIDSSSNGNNGTLGTGTTQNVSGKHGTAYDFNGSSTTEVNMGDVKDYSGSGPWSIVCWFKVRTWTKAYQYIFGKGDDQYRIQRDFTRNNLEYSMAFDGNGGVFRTGIEGPTVNPSDGNWHHAAFSFVSGGAGVATITAYYDNQNMGNVVSSTTDPVGDSSSLKIGENGGAGQSGREHDGQIDECAIFDRVLSALEISQIKHLGLVGKRTSIKTGVTVSPSVLTLTSSVQAPTIVVVRNITVSPSVLTLVASVQAPTVSISSTISVAVLNLTVSVQAPSIITTVSILVGVLTITASVQAPSVKTDRVISPSVLNLIASVQPPTIITDRIISVGALSLLSQVQAPVIIISESNLVGVLTLIASVQAPQVKTDTVISVAVLTLIASIQAPQVSVSESNLVNVLNLTVAVQAPNIVTDAVISVAVLNITASVQAPTVIVSESNVANVLTLTASVQAPTISGTAIVSVNVLSILASVQAPNVVVDESILVNVLVLTSSVQAPTVITDSVNLVSVLTLVVSIIAPTIVISESNIVDVLVLIASVQAPVISTDTVITVAVQNLTTSVQAPTISTDTVISVGVLILTVSIQAPTVDAGGGSVTILASLVELIATLINPKPAILEPQIYNRFKTNLIKGLVDLDGSGKHQLKVALLDNTYTFNPDHNIFTEISGSEITGINYTAGGEILQNLLVNQDDSSNTATFDADNIVWSNSTITSRYIVLYDNTLVTKDLIFCIDLEEDKISESEDFTIQWHDLGLVVAQ